MNEGEYSRLIEQLDRLGDDDRSASAVAHNLLGALSPIRFCGLFLAQSDHEAELSTAAAQEIENFTNDLVPSRFLWSNGTSA